MRCAAKTAGGARCRRAALRGERRCHAHSERSDVGRPSKLSDELERKFCDALRAGNYTGVAAAYAGISATSVYRWLAAAKREGASERLVAFGAAVEQAESHAEAHAVAIVRRSMNAGDWRAAGWYLERRHPQGWRSGGSATTAPAAEPAADIDVGDPRARELLSELLRHRRADGER